MFVAIFVIAIHLFSHVTFVEHCFACFVGNHLKAVLEVFIDFDVAYLDTSLQCFTSFCGLF